MAWLPDRAARAAVRVVGASLGVCAGRRQRNVAGRGDAEQDGEDGVELRDERRGLAPGAHRAASTQADGAQLGEDTGPKTAAAPPKWSNKLPWLKRWG